MSKTNLYTDGGCIGGNPSREGGTWAWCHVVDDRRIRDDSGWTTPELIGLPFVTNNLTELLAAVLGMESMPANWDGTLYTDSQVTLYRVERRSPRKKAARMNGIPSALVERLNAARNRLGNYSVILLGGHPTYSDLALGHRPDGLPVSQHNVHTDKLCNLAKEKFQITSGTRL